MKRDITPDDEADRFKKLFDEKGVNAFKFSKLNFDGEQENFPSLGTLVQSLDDRAILFGCEEKDFRACSKRVGRFLRYGKGIIMIKFIKKYPELIILLLALFISLTYASTHSDRDEANRKFRKEFKNFKK